MALCVCGCGEEAGVLTRTRGAGYIKGEQRRFVRGHGRRGTRTTRVAAVQQYRNILTSNGQQVSLHRLRAERALGRPLPVGAIVHHADGSRRDDAPLVICENDAYHKLLHARMRVKAAGGNPNADAVCSICRKAKPRAMFAPRASGVFGVRNECRQCKAEQWSAARG